MKKHAQADHTCSKVDQKGDYSQMAFQIKSTTPLIGKLNKNNYLLHFIEPT